MKLERIREIAKDEGLSEVKVGLFVKFFSKRFPDEEDEIRSYCAQWARRFKDDPYPAMDRESKQIYLSLIVE